MEELGQEFRPCEERMNYLSVLSIAGSDPSGGAGIQADLKTISALGGYAATAITAVTVQNTVGVMEVHCVPAGIVAGQIRAVMDDLCPKAVKLGMVNDVATIIAVADALEPYLHDKTHPLRHVVVDPVMVSTSGHPLMMSEAVEAFKVNLMPMATLVTPNMPEAEVLSQIRLDGEDAFDKAALRIAALGCPNVLIKGGHSDGREKTDRLYDCQGRLMRSYSSPTVDTRNTHGTGCTFSAAITTLLAMDVPLEEAIAGAKDYLTDALRAGAHVTVGHGHGPVNHFYNPHKQQIMI